MVQNKRDKVLEILINVGFVLAFSLIVYIVYKFFIEQNYGTLRSEGFVSGLGNYSSKTIYETSIENEFGDNQRMLCSMIPTIDRATCKVADTPYVIYNFPVHMIKLLDGSILAVFNDGRLYQKQSITSTMWKGPLQNSMPRNSIPLRMITMTTDFDNLLGVGYDNILYIKAKNEKGHLDLNNNWQKVPNNSDIIYVIFDRETNYLISINKEGQLLTKSSKDITTPNKELKTLLDRPILRLYYDLNGYMLAIDNKFDMYQFNDINWKETELNLIRGANPNKLQDVLYHNDGKMYGLVFNKEAHMVQIMKQSVVFYLGEFFPINLKITPESSENFVMSDSDIIKAKVGSDYEFNIKVQEDNETDDDPNFAYQKQLLESKKKLREFCKSRNSGAGENINSVNNYELIANVEENKEKINSLKSILNSLIKYEPNKDAILEKYPHVLSDN